jgi:GDP-L-fucose synthase
MAFWNEKKVVITGGSGFLGSHLVESLRALGAEVFVPRKKDFNFISLDACSQCLNQFKPQIVIHSAAFYGGIWINQLYPGRIYYENLVMGANMMEAARLAQVDKFVGIGTACSYPGYLQGELSETQLWDGIPHETVVNYGLTKKMMSVQGWAYKKQYNFNAIHLILTNLYGPRDSYNPDRSHVVAALIRKFVEATLAHSPSVEIWGTGKPIREFLYVQDCADAIIRAAEVYDDVTPLNVGTGMGTSIRELAEAIHKISGFKGDLTWNSSKPDGQLKKILNITRLREVLGWSAPTSLQDGLTRTIRWYETNKAAADARD